MTTTLALAGPGSVLPLAALVVVVAFLALWGVSLVLGDVSIVDPAWGPAFVLVALVGLLAGDADSGRRVVLFTMVALWGLRLGVHLGRRKLGEIGEEDKRYVEMRKKRGDTFPLYSLGVVFGFQALLVLIVSLPVQVGTEASGGLNLLVVPGVLLWAVGLYFETVGDYQLDRFKQDPENKGKVMDQGLWKYTRHPNYFGDFAVWWGIWLVALTVGGAWWTFIGPAVMTLLLTKVSGAGLMEKSIGSRREGYDEYVQRTSGFIPLPPKS